DRTGDPRYFPRPGGGRLIVRASRVRVRLPCSGNSSLFTTRASTYSLSNPQGQLLGSGEIEIVYEEQDPQPAAVQQYVERQVAMIRAGVGNINNDLAQFRQRLRESVVSAINSRTQRLERDRGLNGALGLPVRHQEGPPRAVPVARKRIDMRRIQARPSGKA